MPRGDDMGRLCTEDCVLKGNPFVMPTSDDMGDCVLKGYPFIMPTSEDMGRLSAARLPLYNAVK